MNGSIHIKYFNYQWSDFHMVYTGGREGGKSSPPRLVR